MSCSKSERVPTICTENFASFVGGVCLTGQMKQAVIYVPGIGDHHYKGQLLLIRSWRLWGVRPVMVRMEWNRKEGFEQKLQRLLDTIDELASKHYSVSLIGASAGAGAVINAFARRQNVVKGVVCIAGKIHRPEAIGSSYQKHSPAFIESAYMVQASLDHLDFDADRSRVQSRYALFDPIVPHRDSEIPGALNKQVRTMGHAFTIATQLLFGAPGYIRWLKRLQTE